MDTLTGMRAFLAVIDAGSFTAAGERLGISTALASKYVAALEARLGVSLLYRTTRSLRLTEIGGAYAARARQVIGDFDELEAVTRDRSGTPCGHLIVTAPVCFGEMYLTDTVVRFLDRYPEISVELRLTDRVVDLIDEGVDLAVRIARLEDASAIARRLAPARILPCAAPAYLTRHGTPAHPRDLARHACIIDTNFTSPRDWPFQIDGVWTSVRVAGRFAVNSARASRDRIVAGAGIGLIPSYAIGPDLRRGSALPVLADWPTLSYSLTAVYPHNRHLAPKVRSFIDFLAAEFGDPPVWDRL